MCYKRFCFQKWEEIKYKRIILSKLLITKKTSENEKQLFSINNSFQNNSKYDNNRLNSIGNIKKIVFNNSTLLKDKILSPYRPEIESNKNMNIKKRIKKSKNIACNIFCFFWKGYFWICDLKRKLLSLFATLIFKVIHCDT